MNLRMIHHTDSEALGEKDRSKRVKILEDHWGFYEVTTVEEQHQNISFIFMIKQRLPKFLVDVGGYGRTLEVHGGKFGEGVLIQVSIIFAEMFVFHGEFIDVNFLDDHPFSIKILTEEKTEIYSLIQNLIKTVQKKGY